MILQYPHEKLRTVCKEIPDRNTVEAFLPHFETLVSKVENIAAGLAAPQTGLSYCLIWIKDFGYLINPKIVSHSDEMIPSYESCLSIPNETFTVQRYRRVTVIYKDKKFKLRRKVFRDRWAIVAQHEIDHLSGKTLKETGIPVILAPGPVAQA